MTELTAVHVRICNAGGWPSFPILPDYIIDRILANNLQSAIAHSPYQVLLIYSHRLAFPSVFSAFVA